MSHNVPLRPILIALIIHLLHADLHSIPRERHVLALHLRARILLNIQNDGPDGISHESDDSDKDEKEDEGKDFLQAVHFRDNFLW